MTPNDRIRRGVYRSLPTHEEIYEQHALKYEALVSHEDHQGNILRAIREIAMPEGLDIVDLGAGTGRLATLLMPTASSVLAFDLSPQMLGVARTKLTSVSGSGRWLAAAADHRHLPIPSRCTDLLVSGWSVSYVATWFPKSWRHELETWLTEAGRVLRPQGRIVLFESLGTGNESPQRLPHLQDFYLWLDRAEFSNSWLRTDYLFESEQQADELTSFFFGEEMKSKIRRGRTITLPECTGVWWKQL